MWNDVHCRPALTTVTGIIQRTIFLLLFPTLVIYLRINRVDPTKRREERKLRVFENRVLRGIFVTKRDEVTGEWRKLHNEELNDLYCSPNIVRVIKSIRMGWAEHVARKRERRGVYWVLVGKPEGMRPLG